MADRHMSAWQKIETAPQDGTEFLAWAPDAGGTEGYYGVAQWATQKDYIPQSVAGWFWPFAYRPTHWMPLPEPPTRP